MKSKTSKRLLSVCVMALLSLPVARAQTITIADIRLEGSQYTGARWITADTPAELKTFCAKGKDGSNNQNRRERVPTSAVVDEIN